MDYLHLDYNRRGTQVTYNHHEWWWTDEQFGWVNDEDDMAFPWEQVEIDCLLFPEREEAIRRRWQESSSVNANLWFHPSDIAHEYETINRGDDGFFF